MNHKIIVLIIALLFSVTSFAQETYKDKTAADSALTYQGGTFYEVINYTENSTSQVPKNVILMIGDGMGVAHIYSGLTANGGHLFLENFKHIGFSKTFSSDNYITDSAAGGTALSTGVKTKNGAIGVDPNQKPVKTIVEEAEEKGLATGLVSTSAITHATPASFIAHQVSRNMYEAIAADFLKTDIDVFIGGGYKHFTAREDGRNLANELKEKGYQVLQEINQIATVTSGKLAGLTSSEHPEKYPERGEILPIATNTAINILKNDADGFFLMIEGSQIDWGAHQNSTQFVVEEVLDFDKTIGEVLKFAANNNETLIIVTADHETGGLSLLGGNFETGVVKGGFNTLGHSAEMVPVFAFGPGASNFTGIMDNTDIYKKIKALLIK